MKKDKIMMISGGVLLLALFIFPLWNISLIAPQYPEPIGMDIWINKITDHNPNDIQNINILNHYVGMKDIPTEMDEFAIFPIVILTMSALGIIFGLIGKRKLYLTWFIMMALLGSAGMYDFYLWEYDYGHNLKETAAIKFTDEEGKPMAYQPPLIGSKTILNFEAVSLPMFGAYLMFLGMALSLWAFFTAAKKTAPRYSVALLLTFLVISCEVKPVEITYGSDSCDFCRMSIVDSKHAAEIVTEKGKIFKYDAIECMMNNLTKWEGPSPQLKLVNTFDSPAILENAEEVHYLISPEIPSPMGANLTAFKSYEEREKFVKNPESMTLGWTDLKLRYRVK